MSTRAKKATKRKPAATKKKAATKVVKKVVKRAAKKTVAKKTAKKPAKKVAKKPVKKTVKKTVKKAVKKVAKKPAKKPANKVAKKAPKKTNNKIVKKAVKQKQPAKRPVKKTSKKTTKVAKAMSGTVQVVAVDGINPYEMRIREHYMSQTMRLHFRKILIAWRDRLMADANRTVSQMRNGTDLLADLNDRATQEEEFNLELRARDRDRKLIKKIESAIRSIDEGGYGYCAVCGEEIGLRRLEARPTADLCVDCKTLDEIREKQTGT